MSRMMIQAAVTMNQLQKQLDSVGHNIANSDTAGYKSRETEFSSLLYQQIDNLTHPANQTGRLTPDGLRVGSGARVGSTNNNLNMGAFKTTDRALDLALTNKNHMFQVQVNRGAGAETLYTRDGSFYLQRTENPNTLVLATSDGHPVLGQNGPITITGDFDDIRIQDNGAVYVRRGEANEMVGQLNIVEAVRPHLLTAEGNNFFRLSDDAALNYNANDIFAQVNMNHSLVKSGVLEQSNVDLSKEMTDMITAQRSYQFNARTITMGEQMLGLINQLR